MKVWNALFNIFAIVIIAIMMITINRMDEANRKQFEEVRLSYAVDYAVEAAFRAAIDTDSIGTDYANGGMEEVKVNPSMVLPAFYNVLCMSYDISMTDENIAQIQNSIATGVLAAVDGYYVLEEVEVDKDPTDINIGGEYDLKWGVKRPYIVYTDNGNRLFAVNLVNDKWSEYVLPTQQHTNEAILTGSKYDETADAGRGYGVSLTREKADQAISKLITEDINYAINARNINHTENVIRSFYVPSSTSMTAVNDIKSPSLIMIFQDSTFLNGYDLDAISIGGARVRVKAQVLGFTVNGDPTGQKYYCYAGQQMGGTFKSGEPKPGISIVERLSSIHQATKKGYLPHFMFLLEPYGD